jgi:hypothetical protein
MRDARSIPRSHCFQRLTGASSGAAQRLLLNTKVPWKWRLDKQKEAEKWAGQTVIVTGDLDAKKKVIMVDTIQPLK